MRIDNEYSLNYNLLYQFKEDLDMAQISMRIDDDIKKRAEEVCDAMGITMTTAITLYLVKLGNEMRIPFEVSVDPFNSTYNQKILRKSINQLENGEGIEHEIVEVD